MIISKMNADKHGISAKLFLWIESYGHWLLPVLLIFSRAVADITVLLVGLIFLLRCYQIKDWFWTKTIWFRLNLAFWFYLLIINVPLSINVADSLLYAITYMRWPLFAAGLAYWIFANQVRQRDFLIALLVVSIFVIFDTGLQFVSGEDIFGISKYSDDRLTGPFRGPVPGIMMLRVFFIILFLTAFIPQLKASLSKISFVMILLVTGTLFMLITGERMALILFFCCSILVLLGLALEQRANQLIILLGLFIMLGLTLMLIILEPSIAERSLYSAYAKLKDFVNSDYGKVFSAAIESWKEYPFFGSGIHTYKQSCEQIGFLNQQGMSCTHPHNLYLHIGAETGWVGLILFSLAIAAIFRAALHTLVQSKKWFLMTLSLSVLSVSFWPLIGGISILNNGVAALVWLGVGWVLAISRQRESAAT